MITSLHKSVKTFSYRVLFIALIIPFLSAQATAASFTSVTSGNWNDPATWLVNGSPNTSALVPTMADDVVIQSGHTVNMATIGVCKDLVVAGNLTGTSTLSPEGNVELSGTLSTTSLVLKTASIFTFKTGGTMPDLAYSNVVVDIPTGTTLVTNSITEIEIKNTVSPTIATSLLIKSGNLRVDNVFDMTGLAVSISGGSSSITFGGIKDIVGSSSANFINLNQGGTLIIENIGKGQSPKRQFDVLFPVGTDGTYSPVTINNKDTNPASINGAFGVTVYNGIYYNGSDGTAITDNAVDKTWKITLFSGDSEATITYAWSQQDELNGFNPANGVIGEYNAGWKLLTGTTVDPTNRIITRVGVIGHATTAPVYFPRVAVLGGPVTPLPVELFYFNAIKKNNEVALTWETASEKNSRGFEIQRSQDGRTYEAIGFVASSSANTSTSQRYSYTDKISGKEGLVYYRLKQVDLDGTAEYYAAKVIDLGRLTATAVAWPNPFREQLQVALEANESGPAELVITDMTGKVVYAAQHQLHKGENAIGLALKNQPAGLYFLKVVTSNLTYTNRLMKQ